jgi:hypothetical protein
MTCLCVLQEVSDKSAASVLEICGAKNLRRPFMRFVERLPKGEA